MKIKNKLLHITPHLGGGVGSVLLNWLSKDKTFCHSIITLDFANTNAVSVCKKHKILLYSQPDTQQIFKLINSSDIVILHFWNHPILYDFIIRNQLPPCRLIIWAHISGLEPPNVITQKILEYPDKFIYTTPISQEIDDNDVILSTSGVEKFENLQTHPHEGFTAGYIGTVDYAKMHPKYIETLSKTNTDKFIIVGGDNEKLISQEADSRFIFTGKVADIRPYLSQMDVFAYLLNPKHFGTAEQVLQEALAAGVVPVVLNNKCEQSIVTHNKTGLVAQNLEEYISYINLLNDNKILRKTLSQNAKKYAAEFFKLDKLIEQWNSEFIQVMKKPKTVKKWTTTKNELTSYDIFLESLGSYSDIFMLKSNKKIKTILSQPNWQSASKGTPKQYLQFLGGNKLERLCELYEQ